MQFQIVIVLVVAALATAVAYLVLGRILPESWRSREVEESEGFTIDSVNVLIGLLFLDPARLRDFRGTDRL